MNQHLHMLRNLAVRMGVSPLRQVALLPGTKAVYRVTVHYETGRAADCIATLRRWGMEDAVVETVYLGRFGHKPIVRRLSLADYEYFAATMQSLRFDQLADEDKLPFYGADLWLVERAAGGFLKGVVFTPASTASVYLQLMATIRQYLPEAVREIGS
jgi:hypothetical protein